MARREGGTQWSRKVRTSFYSGIKAEHVPSVLPASLTPQLHGKSAEDNRRENTPPIKAEQPTCVYT